MAQRGVRLVSASVFVLLAIFAMMAATPTSLVADNDPNEDFRNGQKLGKRNTIIHHTFKLGKNDTSELDGRLPNKADNGSLWVVGLGDWAIDGKKGGEVVQNSILPISVNQDQGVNIDAGEANVIARFKSRPARMTSSTSE